MPALTFRRTRAGLRVYTGAWPFRRWLLLDATGYPIGGNTSHHIAPGTQMLAAGRRYLKGS